MEISTDLTPEEVNEAIVKYSQQKREKTKLRYEKNYEKLADVYGLAVINHPENYDAYQKALNQAQSGKGHKRHADENPFEKQKIFVINDWVNGSPVAGQLFQAIKKLAEAARLSKDNPEKALPDLLGAMNYTAAAVIRLLKNS